MTTNAHGFSKWIMVVIIFIIIVGAGSTYAVYNWQHNNVSSLNTQVTSLDNQIANLKGELGKKCQNSTGQANTPQPCQNYDFWSPRGVEVFVFKPTENEIITSPVAVIGMVPGSWSFEAEFQLKIVDSKGVVIAQAPARLLGNWQTSNLVPFSAQLTYSDVPTGAGRLILQKDNPSGLPNNDDAISVPIRFSK